jgi:hypothetical protein
MSATGIQTEVKKHVMKAALKKAVDDGILLQVKSSYKLSTAAKEASKAKVVKEVAVVKKTVKKVSWRTVASFRQLESFLPRVLTSQCMAL